MKTILACGVAVFALAIGTGLTIHRVEAQQKTLVTSLPYSAVIIITDTLGQTTTTRKAVKSDGSVVWITDGFHTIINDMSTGTNHMSTGTDIVYDVRSNMQLVGPLVSRRVRKLRYFAKDCQTAFNSNASKNIQVTCEPDGQQFGYPVMKVMVIINQPTGQSLKIVSRSMPDFGWFELERQDYGLDGKLTMTYTGQLQPGEPDERMFQVPSTATVTHNLVEAAIAQAIAAGKPLTDKRVADLEVMRANIQKEANGNGDHRFDQ